ncbi:hypothetical protein D1818_21790 [Aquimarina sp. BL5]|uniref:STAS/SEC14 domain-containing protein n=1 Tax=Aquimarina sp. BL5 TaxID=1714860 RepID=UPI000E4C17EE|nr:STAS/SEC14 domain-containing protein [Aquimarina sp. BL5]AXT53329.1 hypothetical protein D1818_21790 [Aquimarina sp. BL5]RKN02748.1 hypothetical protein D7036_15895 [Aquimarina sp. BL5]
MKCTYSKKPVHKHELDIGIFYFHKNFVISEINEGVILTYENASELIKLGKTHYGDKTPFVYIANRINSYSFEPTNHFKTNEQFPNVKGYAVVSYNSIGSKIAELERSFLKIPTRTFYKLDDAIKWVDKLVISD